jgi:hypothetical protein
MYIKYLQTHTHTHIQTFLPAPPRCAGIWEPVSVDDGRDGEERTRAAEAELRSRRFERSVVKNARCGALNAGMKPGIMGPLLDELDKVSNAYKVK